MKKVLLLVLSIFVLGATSVNAASSYEMFYPMVAGKTAADGFIYKLKILKENIRGSLIFGASQKAEYNIFLASKRLLESEKLLSEQKNDLALATLDKVIVHLTSAKKSSENIKILSVDMSKIYMSNVDVAKKLQEILRFAP